MSRLYFNMSISKWNKKSEKKKTQKVSPFFQLMSSFLFFSLLFFPFLFFSFFFLIKKHSRGWWDGSASKVAFYQDSQPEFNSIVHVEEGDKWLSSLTSDHHIPISTMIHKHPCTHLHTKYIHAYIHTYLYTYIHM